MRTTVIILRFYQSSFIGVNAQPIPSSQFVAENSQKTLSINSIEMNLYQTLLSAPQGGVDPIGTRTIGDCFRRYSACRDNLWQLVTSCLEQARPEQREFCAVLWMAGHGICFVGLVECVGGADSCSLRVTPRLPPDLKPEKPQPRPEPPKKDPREVLGSKERYEHCVTTHCARKVGLQKTICENWCAQYKNLTCRQFADKCLNKKPRERRTCLVWYNLICNGIDF